MKICGIICEYNPFHAGHVYHIEQARKLSGADTIVAIMSGNFVQRGEPAIFDKWARAQAAIQGGVDMVLELPCLYALSSAESFAFGGVQILSQLNAVSYLSFGMENIDLSLIRRLAKILIEEPEEYRRVLKEQLNRGIGFAAARSASLRSFVPNLDENFLSCPNNILALEYFKALARLGSPIVPVPVLRKGSSYLDASLSPVPSALAIRHAIKRGGLVSQLSSTFSGKRPIFSENLFSSLLYRLRSMSLPSIAALPEVSEGFEYSLQNAAKYAKNYAELVDALRSRRYPITRVQRILLYAFLGITRDSMAFRDPSLHYARVLSIKKSAVPLLSYLSKSASIPLVVQPKKLGENPLFAFDCLASDVYGAFSGQPGGLDYSARFQAL